MTVEDSAHAWSGEASQDPAEDESPGATRAKGRVMQEMLGGLLWLVICVLSILFWWPLLVVIVQYWI